MTVPESIRRSLKETLSNAAEGLHWESLRQSEKTRYYEIWTRDPKIGGILDHYMDRGQIRVYIKDTLLKDFGRRRSANPALPLGALGIDSAETCAAEYIKPHGRRTKDGRVVCWGRADDWKNILMAVHERAYVAKALPFAVVLTAAVGKYMDMETRSLVEDGARRLGIGKVVWLD